MNSWIKFRIKLNPNYIDKMKISDLNDDIVRYACSNNYCFNSSSCERYLVFPSYLEKFQLKGEFQDFIKSHISSEIFRIFFRGDTVSCCLFFGDELLQSFSDLKGVVDQDILCQFIVEHYSYFDIPENLSKEEKIIQKYLQKDSSNLLNVRSNFSSFNVRDCVKQELLYQPQHYYSVLKKIESDLELSESFSEILSDSFKQEFIQEALDCPLLNEDTPVFLANNDEYLLKAILNDPVSLIYFRGRFVEHDDNVSLQVASKIRDEHLIFSAPIPRFYRYDKKILKEIYKNNIYLIEENDDISYILDEISELLFATDYKINEKTPRIVYKQFDFLMKALADDFKVVKYINFPLDLNENYLKRVSELYFQQSEVSFMDSSFLQCNPFIMLEAILQGKIKIDEVDFSKIDNYYVIYEKLREFVYHNKIDISLPIPNMEAVHKKMRMTDNGALEIEIDDFERLEEVIYRLDTYQYKNVPLTIFISLEDRMIPRHIDYFKNLQNQGRNISIKYDSHGTTKTNSISLDDVIKDEMFLDLCVKDIKDSNFSPFEKYIAVYGIVKNFKKYKVEKDGAPYELSRGIYRILNNNYICCAGYSLLLVDLLERVGIPAMKFGLGEADSNDKVHAEVYYYINDEKYGINSYYVADPTNDDVVRMGETYFVDDYDLAFMTNKDLISSKNGNYSWSEVERNSPATTLKNLEPSFYEKVSCIENLEEQDKMMAEHFDKMINHEIAPKKIVDGIMVVKKKNFKNFNDEQLLDLRMFYINSLGFNKSDNECKREYDTYAEMRVSSLMDKKIIDINNSDLLEDWCIVKKQISSLNEKNSKLEISVSMDQITFTVYDSIFVRNLTNMADILRMNGYGFDIEEGVIYGAVKFKPNLDFTLFEQLQFLTNQKEMFYKFCNFDINNTYNDSGRAVKH